MSNASSQVDEPDMMIPINKDFNKTAFPIGKYPANNSDYISMEDKENLANKLSSQAKRRNSNES